MNKIKLLSCAIILSAFGASANTVLFEESFAGDWTVNFPISLELDHQQPMANVSPLFQNENGVSMPWWHVRDDGTTDRSLASHSYYRNPGTSNDWICSRAVEIPTEGFTLTFGAQSYLMRKDNRLSDLRLYILESPLSAEALPETPYMLIEKVSEGASSSLIYNDFVPHSVNLDEFAGKTIYIVFANLNEDKDLLLIDDVKIERLDQAELSVASADYIVRGDYPVTATIYNSTTDPINNWTLTFTDGKTTDIRKGESLAGGETLSYEFNGNVEGDELSTYTVTFAAAGLLPVVKNGSIKGLDFEPYHRVLFEEGTGMWCGNCPLGMATIDRIMEHEDMRNYVIPVSIHLPGTPMDYLTHTEYAYMIGFNSAPCYRLDRSTQVRYFSTTEDILFDLDNPRSVGGIVKAEHELLTLADIDIKASYNEAKTKVECEVTVTPAITFNDADLAIGIIMKENNIWSEDSPLMVQTNYYAGADLADNIMGWTLQPEHVKNIRFHDSPRGIWDFHGIDGSVPANLPVSVPYVYKRTVDVPDTYYIESLSNGDVAVGSPRIVHDNITMVAFLYDRNSGKVINSNIFPMSEVAMDRYDNRNLIQGVEEIEVEASFSGPAEYYNLQGVRVSAPERGIYIEKRGDKVRKVVLP